MSEKLLEIEVVDDKIVLPAELKSWLEAGDRLVGFVEGDALVLKRLRLSPLSQVAERAPQAEEMPLIEIAAEVHTYRREKRRAGSS